jgi:hypothetical protein
VTEPGLWSIREVADFLGVKPGSARGILSRAGVTATTYVRGPSGRAEARYGEAQVRQAAAQRPGRGHRSDLDA